MFKINNSLHNFHQMTLRHEEIHPLKEYVEITFSDEHWQKKVYQRDDLERLDKLFLYLSADNVMSDLSIATFENILYFLKNSQHSNFNNIAFWDKLGANMRAYCLFKVNLEKLAIDDEFKSAIENFEIEITPLQTLTDAVFVNETPDYFVEQLQKHAQKLLVEALALNNLQQAQTIIKQRAMLQREKILLEKRIAIHQRILCNCNEEGVNAFVHVGLLKDEFRLREMGLAILSLAKK